MFRLTLNFAGKSIRKFNFDKDSICIGRDPDCEIAIDNIGVSRKHATIETANGEYILTDLKSHNGTFVKGARIYHHQLRDGDEFFIGKYSLNFESLDVTEDTEPPPELQGGSNMQDLTFRLDRGEIERIMGSSATGNVPKLAQFAPEKEKQTFKLEEAYALVGKHPEAPIRYTGFRAPEYVAILVRDEKWFHVQSLSSKVPLIVNGKKVTRHQLADGDMIQLGKRKYRFALA
ncbi:MAG: FHA domain-containing protein [Planctomycetota bacterium]